MPFEADTTITSYAQIHASVRPEVKAELVRLCQRSGESIATLLTRLIREEATRQQEESK